MNISFCATTLRDMVPKLTNKEFGLDDKAAAAVMANSINPTSPDLNSGINNLAPIPYDTVEIEKDSSEKPTKNSKKASS